MRFYVVEKIHQNVPALPDVLEGIFGLGEAHARQATLMYGIIARLERLETGPDFVTGEFTRLQNTNFPSEVHEDGVVPLSVDGPLGHGIVFRFRPSDSLLAIQYDPRILAPSRINAYLLEIRADATYIFRPRMNQDSWARMAQHPLRKLTLGVASPADLAEIEDAGASVADALRSMGEAYEAPSITVELGMGRRNGALGEATKEMARRFFEKFQQEEVDLRKLRGVVETEQGIPNDEINLLDEVLSKKEELDLPENDPEKSYQMRKSWLVGQMPRA